MLLSFLLAAFLLRFFFGLYAPPVTDREDYVQTYAIGLKAYTTQTWPYYGPDVQGPETSFKTQIPGALEGLLIAVPLAIWPAPESPFFFLNLLTFLASTLLGWYCCKRLPRFSPWFIFTWTYIAPWNTQYSTQVINPSYAFLGSVLFFLGFLETVPSLKLKLIQPKWANAMMGFGLFWVMQLHMSWVAFIPFLLLSLYFQFKSGKIGSALLYGFLGALPLLTLLIPTFLRYGFQTGNDVKGFMSGLNTDNLLDLPGTLARFLAIGSFELPRFIALNTHDRIHYLLDSPLLLLPGFFLWGAFFFQPVAMLGLWFVKRHPRRDWKEVKKLILGTFLVLYACFLFTPNMAASFRILLFFPLILLYSFYCWDFLARQSRWWRTAGLVFILSGVVFQAGYTVNNMKAKSSVYAQGREAMAKAIEAKDYRLYSERRPGSLY